MKIYLPPPSAMNFLSGVFAGAGINMLTSVSTGPPGNVSTAKIGLDSALWVISAAALTWAAQITDRAERDAELIIDRDFSEAERIEVRELHRDKAVRRAYPPLIGTVVALVFAVLLLPGLLD